MKSFLLSLVKSASKSAINGAATATNSGADFKTVGIAAGITALAGLLQALVTHPSAQNPAVAAALTAQTPK